MNEQYWKIGFLIIWILWCAARMVFARGARKNKSKNFVTPKTEKFLVALNFIGMMVLPFIIIFSGFLDSYKIGLPVSIRFLSAAVLVLNIILFAKIHKDLGKNWSPILEIKEDHKLVNNGIYKYIRHPMYSHLWMWVIFQGLLLDNYLLLVSGAVAWALLYFIRVPKEELMLKNEFGEQYDNYIRKTGRVFPKLIGGNN